MLQVQDSDLRPLGYEPSELPTAPTCDVEGSLYTSLRSVILI